VNLFARVSVRRDTNPPDQPDTSGLGFNEYRVVGSYREPRVAGTNADLLVNGFLEQAVRTSFNFSRKGVTAEATKQLDPIYRLSGRYAFGVTKLFDERLDPEDELLIDRLFPQVRLSVFSSSLVRDTRDDPIDPSSGHWVALDGEFAVRTLGSEVGFAKTYLQSFAYRRVSRSRRVVLALGARLGLATGFPRDVAVTDENGEPALDENGQPVVATVKDLPASERFFAGGDTTVRGFAIDRLGTPDTIDQQGFPIGGSGLLVLNVELRVPLWQNIGVVGSLDGGNVYARAGGINLGQLRGSLGFGLRYQSPIGPLRVDLGFKMDRRVVAGKREPLTALHISFGQAF
jgi:outer membrane protein insertion porin family